MKKKDGPYRKESSWRPVVDAVAAFHRENGYGPSVGEIAAAIGRSPTAVQFQIDKLLEDGLLVKTPGKIRSIRLSEYSEMHY